MTPELVIRGARDGDLGAASTLLGSIGFQDRHRTETLQFIHVAPQGRVWMIEHRGALVGTSAALGLGASGWLSVSAVVPEWRHRGIAAIVLDMMDAWLRSQGVRTVLLLATEQGGARRRSAGFVADGDYAWMVRPPAAPRTGATLGIRPLRPRDIDAVRALDAAATGEDRTLVLDAALPSGGLVAEDEHGIMQGFHLDCPWGPGPTVGRDAEIGRRLVAAVRGAADHPTTWLLPATGQPVQRELCGDGPAMRLLRMRKGPRVPMRPEMIFGAFNFYWG